MDFIKKQIYFFSTAQYRLLGGFNCGENGNKIKECAIFQKNQSFQLLMVL